MRVVKRKIPDNVKAVLEKAIISGPNLALPEKLDRKTYTAVNTVLELAGGKWNRAGKCHVFPGDPREILGLALEAGEIVDIKQTLQFFPTPPEVAHRMVKLADIHRRRDRVLEPSAGTGRLLEAIFPTYPFGITAVEIDPAMAEDLRRTYPLLIVHCADFLQLTTKDTGLYDRIIMNPPFTRGTDLKHMEHALGFLGRGGRLVSVCLANGPNADFAAGHRAKSYGLPAGTFEDTQVQTQIVVIDR